MSKSNIDRYDNCLGEVLRWGSQGCHCFFKKQLLETKIINSTAVRSTRLRRASRARGYVNVEEQREVQRVRDWKRTYARAKWVADTVDKKYRKKG